MGDEVALRSSEIARRIREHRLIVILRRVEPQAMLLEIVDELADAGARIFEVTFDAPSAADDLHAIRSRLDGRLDGPFTLGAGTLLAVDRLDQAHMAGAEFGVSPVIDPVLVRHAVDADLPFIPGGLTPTELRTGWDFGATFMKLFPASAVGPQFIRELRGPLTEIEVIPTGGVDGSNAVAFLEAGAVAVGLGSAIVRATAEERRAIIESIADFCAQMTTRFEGRVCLITGSTGIAAAAAVALAGEGANVFVASRTSAHARDLAELIDGAWLEADLTQEGDVESVVKACVERYGRIDCVYNVAGISARRLGDGALHEMTLDGWRAVMDANATSQFLVCRATVRQMLDQELDASGRRGTILNMGSVIAQHPVPRHFETHGYAATKGAIESFSRSIAAYYAPYGIRVNVIAPGLVVTPMSERAQGNSEIMAFVAEKQPLAAGALRPDDLVGTALYLLSDDSRMVTGQVVTVDGGWSISD